MLRNSPIRVLQPRVRRQPHDRSKRQSPLVNSLEEVGKDHDDQNPLVDHFSQLSTALRRDVDAHIRDILREFLVDSARMLGGLFEILEFVDGPLAFDLGSHS